MLVHFGVNVKATVAKGVDLLGKKFDSLTRVAEDNSLRYLQLIKQSCQAVQLFFFLQISIILSQTLQSQFVSWFNILWFSNILLLEVFDLLGVSSTEKSDLRLRHNLDDLFNNFLKIWRQ